jgi:hypothetical protein
LKNTRSAQPPVRWPTSGNHRQESDMITRRTVLGGGNADVVARIVAEALEP